MPKINLNPSLFDVSAPHNDTETSIEAAEKIASRPKTLQDQDRILKFLAGRMQVGATDEEIRLHFQMAGDYERPRRNELCKAGLVGWVVGHKRRNTGGSNMRVWTVTPAGLRVAMNMPTQ